MPRDLAVRYSTSVATLCWPFPVDDGGLEDQVSSLLSPPNLQLFLPLLPPPKGPFFPLHIILSTVIE